MKNNRSYYSAPISDFLRQTPNEILGDLNAHSEFDVTMGQNHAWSAEIELLQNALVGVDNSHILLEYTIPRMGKRIDAVLLLPNLVMLVEFKVGSKDFDRHAINQVMDYALDLKYFHAESEKVVIVPVLVATLATQSVSKESVLSEDNIFDVRCEAPQNLPSLVREFAGATFGSQIEANRWINSAYRPTPTIIEAAQVLFQGHGVQDISRNDASASNLDKTARAIDRIIDESKRSKSKSICLLTGVPGAGKTLAGLAIANSRQKFEEEEHAVFLSGNGPLVAVLREALARDESIRLNQPKSKSLTKARAFIQNIHHFRDDALKTDNAPHEKVAIFDEAQRAWDATQLSRFMNTKRGLSGFDQSEPEFLIEVMDRHQDWAVIVCLVGEGQDINTGEAGIAPWLLALEARFPHWQVFSSPHIASHAYGLGTPLFGVLNRLGPERVTFEDALHLNVSIRSFRSERLSAFVQAVLSSDPISAATEFGYLRDVYPIALTRDLDSARTWVRNRARGTERFGLTASSGAKRLRPFGIWVDYSADPPVWFLNGIDDIRSSFGLEVAATEFDIQGLELDWTIVAWDGDLRHNSANFEHWEFRGASWNRVNSDDRKRYLLNAYRVLLTRARQGMVIYIPKGDDLDPTRSSEYYEHTFQYLKNIGIPEI